MISPGILDQIRSGARELVCLRRAIHQHPETAFEEFKTAALVADQLRSYGLEVAEGIAGTGVVGTLRGRRPGIRSIGLRADLDALSLQERSTCAHMSRVPGKMHACGHDGHIAMLLGAARHLARNPDFAGTVHFIFQPAEEGLGGGRRMVEEGLFERFPVDAVYGMHNLPGLPVGSFALRAGPMMAASDRWNVTFRGSGGHGGANVDRITDASIPLGQFIIALQTIVSRKVPAVEAAVVSIGHIAGGTAAAPNVIPAEYFVSGTARSFNPAVQNVIDHSLRRLAEDIARAHECEAVVVYNRVYPPVVNRVEQVGIAAAAAASVVGSQRVDLEFPASMGAEDFSFMLNARPGAFIWIGNGDAPDGRTHSLHSPHYDFNDEVLPIGSAYWVSLVAQELGLDGRLQANASTAHA